MALRSAQAAAKQLRSHDPAHPANAAAFTQLVAFASVVRFVRTCSARQALR